MQESLEFTKIPIDQVQESMDFSKPLIKQHDHDCLTEYNLGNSQQAHTYNKGDKFETNSFGTEMD